MNAPETLTLDWHGPLRPAAMDLSAEALERMARPGVYLCVKRYPAAGKVRIYAGMTKNFRLRLREHIAATLGLAHDIADDTGRVVFRHTHRDSLFDAARELDVLHPLAAAEVKRMAWFWALDDSDPYIPWALVEGLLIGRLKRAELEGRTTARGEIIDVVNARGGPAPTGPVRLVNRGAEEALDVLGGEVVWPAEDAA